MARLNKRDYIHIAILISLYIIFVFFLTRSTYVYGSMTDWAQQHWVFPEYFRNLFYANHDLFPSFACNLGGGQNIFNFSYYGLYSPIMLGVLMSSVFDSAGICCDFKRTGCGQQRQSTQLFISHFAQIIFR